MSAFTTDIQEQTIRRILRDFWDDALEIGETRQGLSLALPQTLPDGWQLVVELEDNLPAGVKITDRGRTLSWLAAQGQNTETDALKRQLELLCLESDIGRDGMELFQWFPKGIEAVQIHLFAEAMVNVAHLYYMRDLKPRSIDVVDRTLLRVFQDHQVVALKGRTLDGQTRKKVKVDYLIESSPPMAFQMIRQHGRILSTMERWGYRWNDLRSRDPSLRPAMIYDPHQQDIDSESRSIGEEVCDLFCSYEETERIHEFLASNVD